MKKIFYFALVLVCGKAAFGQTPSSTSCGNPQQPWYASGGHFYICNAGVPSQVDGGLPSAPVQIGSAGYADTGVQIQQTASNSTYVQSIIQNTSNSATASADWVVSNNLGTASTYYGDFGMNSSTFTESGAFNQPNSIYLTGTTGDLALGTTTANAVHILANNSATDAITVSSSNIPTINTPTISGTVSGGTGTGQAVGLTVQPSTSYSNYWFLGNSLGQGTAGGAIDENLVAYVDSSGYANPGTIFVAVNPTHSTTPVPIGNIGTESCMAGTGLFATNCGAGTVGSAYNGYHNFWWDAVQGQTLIDCYPTTLNGSTLNCVHWRQSLFYKTVQINAPVSGLTVGGQNTNNTTATTPTFTAGAGMGTGGSFVAPACQSGHYCSFVSGSLLLTTGTTPTNASAIFTITGLTRTYSPDCLAQILVTAGGTPQSMVPAPMSSTTQTFYAPTTLAANTQFTIVYHCLGT